MQGPKAIKTDECRVVRMVPADEGAYSTFVDAHPESMLYHSLPYLKLIASITDSRETTLLALDQSGLIKGVLPLLAQDGPLGLVLNSLPYYGSNGGVLAASQAAAAALIREYNNCALSEAVCSATIISNPLSTDPVLDIQHSLTDYRIGQFSPIGYAERHADHLMRAYHPKTRNMVRKAAKSGIQVQEENSMIPFLMEVHEENMRAIGGRAKSSKFFEYFPKYFRAGTDYKTWLARLNGEPIAALLLFYFRDTVEYYMPVIRESHRDKQPLSLLIHSSMIEASLRGFRLWNWGGTWVTQKGVYLFKRRWGTYDRNYTYHTQVNNKNVFRAHPNEIIEQYPDFFVVPFRLLDTNTERHA